MTLAKEMVEQNKHKDTVRDRNTSTSGVVITVYEESVTPRSRKQSQDPIKKTKPHSHFTRTRAAPTTHGYDRRAQLLAHSRQLRNYAASQKVPIPLPTIQSQTKSKRKGFWLTKPVRICSCSPSRYMPLCSSSRCRYERVASEEESKEGNRSKNRKSSGKACPLVLSKLKNMLKELSCKEIQR